MGTKNISLKEEAYERLRALKRENESFSDVVLRITESDRWSGFGALSETDIQEGMQQAKSELSTGMEESLEESGNR
ncbi:MAG: antitoxin VapB family protein [Halolamina sp.]|uniref:antitoxin VapB family protein n=1 Tax=Halolamina sp. TaxID=1940283 RepID=UPI002FC3BE5E